MRTTQFMLITHKETPADAQLASHQLMLRAGLIRKLASGIYSWLPLGLRVLHKVENIVRQEMDRCGALEMLMPAIQPAELWLESQRWDAYGDALLKMTDQNNRQFCFGPTHEEVITDIARNEIRSYKQLPLCVYQIQTKFRDEIRPRYGVMRSREFLMKDAYSFHLDQESLEITYKTIYDTYCRIFDRIGLHYRPVLADSGEIGGEVSHEFQVLAGSGEDTIFYSDGSDYAANIEFAEAIAPPVSSSQDTPPLEKIATPNAHSINEVCQFLDVTPQQTVKTLIVHGHDDQLVALALRGDHELNELKTAKHPLIQAPLQFASDAEIMQIVQCAPGSIGPLHLNIPLIVDRSASAVDDFICGANENDYHFRHTNWSRDIKQFEIADLRNVIDGDPSPDGKGTLRSCHGIEVGHIFQLGDKYSRSMNSTVLNEQGRAIPLMMGCYGLGISRVVAATIEQCHDERGIIWPQSIAPFDICLLPLKGHKSQRLREKCDAIYEQLQQAGFDVLLDDRPIRPGVMFADMDLLGIPHRLVLGERGIDNNTIEYKMRGTDETIEVELEQLLEFLAQQSNSTPDNLLL